MPLDIREKLARIDQVLADHDRKRQEIVFAAPWVLAVTMMGTGAALLAAGAAVTKLFGH
jgi:hypothetical protein